MKKHTDSTLAAFIFCVSLSFLSAIASTEEPSLSEAEIGKITGRYRSQGLVFDTQDVIAKAKEGNVAAMNRMSIFCIDSCEDVYWTRLAAEKGSASSQNVLGHWYQGDNPNIKFPKDIRKAIKWFEASLQSETPPPPYHPKRMHSQIPLDQLALHNGTTPEDGKTYTLDNPNFFVVTKIISFGFGSNRFQEGVIVEVNQNYTKEKPSRKLFISTRQTFRYRDTLPKGEYLYFGIKAQDALGNPINLHEFNLREPEEKELKNEQEEARKSHKRNQSNSAFNLGLIYADLDNSHPDIKDVQKAKSFLKKASDLDETGTTAGYARMILEKL